MAPQERTALRVGSIGIRAELKGAGVCPNCSGRLPKRLFQQRSEPLAREECQFSVPLALTSQLPRPTSCKANQNRPSASGVLHFGIMRMSVRTVRLGG
jgi:hypothetical protein